MPLKSHEHKRGKSFTRFGVAVRVRKKAIHNVEEKEMNLEKVDLQMGYSMRRQRARSPEDDTDRTSNKQRKRMKS